MRESRQSGKIVLDILVVASGDRIIQQVPHTAI